MLDADTGREQTRLSSLAHDGNPHRPTPAPAARTLRSTPEAPGAASTPYKQPNIVERAIIKLKGPPGGRNALRSRDFALCGNIDVASIGIWLRDPTP